MNVYKRAFVRFGDLIWPIIAAFWTWYNFGQGNDLAGVLGAFLTVILVGLLLVRDIRGVLANLFEEMAGDDESA